mmetsp:Transcript_13935/g.38650  ORF Transcript_13935/g.38650 Transcript_13935/m.38650 type:complete len:381 (-) Transcript_13935:105-1247(-)
MLLHRLKSRLSSESPAGSPEPSATSPTLPTPSLPARPRRSLPSSAGSASLSALRPRSPTCRQPSSSRERIFRVAGSCTTSPAMPLLPMLRPWRRSRLRTSNVGGRFAPSCTKSSSERCLEFFSKLRLSDRRPRSLSPMDAPMSRSSLPVSLSTPPPTAATSRTAQKPKSRLRLSSRAGSEATSAMAPPSQILLQPWKVAAMVFRLRCKPRCSCSLSPSFFRPALPIFLQPLRCNFKCSSLSGKLMSRAPSERFSQHSAPMHRDSSSCRLGSSDSKLRMPASLTKVAPRSTCSWQRVCGNALPRSASSLLTTRVWERHRVNDCKALGMRSARNFGVEHPTPRQWEKSRLSSRRPGATCKNCTPESLTRQFLNSKRSFCNWL